MSKSTWYECASILPPEGTWCLVQQSNRDIVVAVRCSAWATGFFTSRALKQNKRKVEKLTAPAVRWRLLGVLPPDGVPPPVQRMIDEGKASR